MLHDEKVIEQPANQHTITRRYTEKTIEFIKTHHRKPFFVYPAHSIPHIPLYAGDRFFGKSPRGLFGDVIEEIDHGFGQILDTLSVLDLSEHTLVVFTSDNGPWLPFHTHGGSSELLRDGKGATFEGACAKTKIIV